MQFYLNRIHNIKTKQTIMKINFTNKVTILSYDFFSLNVMDSNLNKIACYSFSPSSIANVECSNTWHVNLNTIKRMMSLELISKFVINLKERCQICV